MSQPRHAAGKNQALARSRARLAAVQALYQMDLAETDLAEVIDDFKSHRLGAGADDETVAGGDGDHFARVLNGVVLRQREIDPMIDQQLATGWTLIRVDAILRAILRAAGLELLDLADVPARVVISEYIDVAHAFFDGDEPKVINGVLDQLARKLRPGELPERRFPLLRKRGAGGARARGDAMADQTSRNEPLHGEEAIIALLAPLTEGYPGAFGLKDDCALISPPPGADLVLKTDPIAEGVHFLPGDSPEDIAWKALAVNASDLAAKGAAPLGYLMALSFPAPPARAWMERFAHGLRDAQQRFGCRLMGGDTDRRPGPLTITITLIGSVPQGKMVQRTTAQIYCTLLVSGTIGDAALGLALAKEPALAAAWGLSQAEAEYLVRRYRRPEPRLTLAPLLRQYAAAAMDLSDGLVKDLERMLRGSGVGGRLRAGDVPLSDAARKVVARQPQHLAQLITGGDDYEVLAAVLGSREFCHEFRSAAERAGVPMTEVGIVGPFGWPGGGLLVDGPDGQPMTFDRTGWDHF